MSLLSVTRDDAITRVTQHAGESVVSTEILVDLIRAEVHARAHAPRAATLSRIARLLAPAVLVDEERLAGICDLLEREGDLVLAPGGILYATPTRVVTLDQGARVFGSVQTRVLASALGREVLTVGATRTVASTDGLAEAVAKVSGAMVTPEAWAGLDRTPNADAAFLATLDQRLTWEALGAGALERDGVLDWRTWQVTGEGARWRRSNEGQLWSARTRFGFHYYAWTDGASPSMRPFIRVFSDDADRARFALTRESVAPFIGRRSVNGDEVRLALPSGLPRSEYRYLSLLARRFELNDGKRSWITASSSAATICALLAERLGIRWEEDDTGITGAQGEAPVVGSGDVPAHEETQDGVAPTTTSIEKNSNPQSSLDELVPRAGITLLLSQLRVATYRDLLNLEIGGLRQRFGVGPTKLSILTVLAEEAVRRRNEASVDPLLQEPARVEAFRGAYDDWLVEDALGHLRPRAKSAIASNGLSTIGDLKACLSASKFQRTPKMGAGTERELQSLINQLEAEGHESLVFGDSAPRNLMEFGQRYLAQVSDHVRKLMELRLIQGWTLQAIAEQRGVSRERVRQLLKREADEVSRGWRECARLLLAPLVNAIEARGGVASTASLAPSHRQLSQWTIDLAAEIGQVEMKWNVRSGISTVLAEEEFEELEGGLRDACEDHPTTVMKLQDLHELLHEYGLRVPEDEINDFVASLLNITVEGDDAFLRRRTTSAAYVRVLRDAGKPISAKDVARLLNEADPAIRARPERAVHCFRRSPEVISVDHGLWVHHDYLPFPRAMLDEVARRCLPIVEAAGGQAVNVRPVLSDLIANGTAPATMTAHMLREALRQTGRVRAWRAGTDVAWLDGDVARTTIEEWAAQVVLELEPPFTYNEVVEEVVRRSGNLASSVYVQVKSTFDDLIPVGGERYISRSATWPLKESFDVAAWNVRQALQGNVLWSAESDTLHIPGIEDLMTRFGRGIVYGLASVDSEFRTRAAGLLIWRASSGSSVWDVVGAPFFDREPVFNRANLHAFLSSFSGVQSHHIASRLITEGLDDGILIRVGFGWYMPAAWPREQQLEVLERQPEILRMTLSSQDFVRESPAREVLNDLRTRHGKFRVPAG